MQTEKRILGNAGEDAAVTHLVSRGYHILARNFLCRYGELDVVAEKDDTVCFVEVRMRSTTVWGDPALTVSYRKQARVRKAALHYMFQHHLKDKMMRFDVVSIIGRGQDARVEHIPDAFDAGM